MNTTPDGYADINLNDVVRVKLNQRGLDILKAKHEELAKFVRERKGKFHDWSPPRTDSEGWSEHQLWCLMQDFGPHIRLGGEAPFETMIQVKARPSSSCERSEGG
jgi:repressor LexA